MRNGDFDAHFWLKALAVATLLLLGACAAEPEGGTCKLSCGKPRVGAGEMIVRPMTSNPTVNISCDSDFADGDSVPLSRPMLVQYQLYQKVGTSGGAGSTDATASGFAADYSVQQVPIGGVGFSPYALGLMATEMTTSEFLNDDGTVSNNQFAGIATPSSYWCSDSCGTMTYEVWPVCRKGRTNTVTARIAVGNIIPEDDWHFTISNEQGTTPTTIH